MHDNHCMRPKKLRKLIVDFGEFCRKHKICSHEATWLAMGLLHAAMSGDSNIGNLMKVLVQANQGGLDSGHRPPKDRPEVG